MKIKGISVFEMHIEKVVFALFFLALLGVFGAQFFIPSNVKVGGKDVAPANAGEIAAEKAARKVNELESQSIHPDVPTTVPDLRAFYEQAAGSTPASESILAFAPSHLNIEGGADNAQDGIQINLPNGVVHAAFAPPAASRPLVMNMGSTLDPRFVEDQQKADPGFSRRLGLTDQPYDVRGISLETTLDAQRLRAGLAVLPKLWWDGRVELLDVEVLRQELLPDGSWSVAEPIAKSPAQLSLADAAQDPDFPPADLRQLLDEEDELRAQIRNPIIMPTIAGEQWIPPSLAQVHDAELAEITPEERQIERLMMQLERLRRSITNLEDQMEKSAHAPTTQPIYYAQGGRGGGRPGGGGRDGGRDGGAMDAEKAERDRKKKIRETQEKRLETFLEQESVLIVQIQDLGGNPNGAPQVDPIKPEDFMQPTDSLTSALNTEITLWAHDFDAQPGTTYRYAVRYWATNPFFGKAGDLTDPQKSLAEGVAVASELSEWSDPVWFAPDVQYFVASARTPQRGQFGADASAEFEVYQFYYGYWRRGVGRVGAGEQIQADLEIPEDLVTFVPDENDPQADPTEVPVDPEAIRKVVDAYLLDVLAGVAGQDGSGAVISTSTGEIFTRIDGADSYDSARERLAASAEQGLAMGAAVLDPSARPDARQDKQEDRERDGRRDTGGPGLGTGDRR